MKNNDGSHTRSGLIKFGLDIVRVKKPKYIMIENVKALIQKKFIDDFYDIVNEIEEIGYKCYYPSKENKKGEQVPYCLNAKDFGIPQNRERIFVICVRNDIDTIVEIPIGKDHGIRLKHLLEESVEDKYYLSEEIQKRFKPNGKTDVVHNELNQVGTTSEERLIGQRDRTYGTNGICPNLTATDYKQPKQIVDIEAKVDRLGGCFDKDGKTHQAGSIYNENGLSPTLDTMQGGYRQPLVKDYDNKIRTLGKLECKGWHDVECRVNSINGIGATIECKNRAKYLAENELHLEGTIEVNGMIDSSKRVYHKKGVSPTITTMQGGGTHPKVMDYKIRKLTPLECFRLMGFDDEDFFKVKELGLSDSALYKLAGNSIVVNCLYYIFKNVFKKFQN